METGKSHSRPNKQNSSGWVSTAGEKVKGGIKIIGTFLKNTPNVWPWLFGRSNDIAILKYSKNLGLSVQEPAEGKITLRATELLLGDILKLSNEEIKRLNEELTKGSVSLTINQDKNVVDIGIDVATIENNVKEKYKEYSKMSDEQRKRVIIGEIVKAVDSSIKEVAKATGGELKRYTDLKLVYGIAQKLYEGHQHVDNGKDKEISHGENKEKIRTAKLNGGCQEHKHVDNGKNEEAFNLSNPQMFPPEIKKRSEDDSRSTEGQLRQVESPVQEITEETIRKEACGLANVMLPTSVTHTNPQPQGAKKGGRGRG